MHGALVCPIGPAILHLLQPLQSCGHTHPHRRAPSSDASQPSEARRRFGGLGALAESAHRTRKLAAPCRRRVQRGSRRRGRRRRPADPHARSWHRQAGPTASRHRTGPWRPRIISQTCTTCSARSPRSSCGSGRLRRRPRRRPPPAASSSCRWSQTAPTPGGWTAWCRRSRRVRWASSPQARGRAGAGRGQGSCHPHACCPTLSHHHAQRPPRPTAPCPLARPRR